MNTSVTEDPDGFVHTGTVLRAIDPAIYVSATAVRQMAALFGCASPEEKQELEGRVAELEQELEDCRQDLKAADYQLNAIDVLKNAGFESKKRAGRPPKGVKV